MRYRTAVFEKELKKQTLEAVHLATKDLKGPDAVTNFLSSLLTESELLMLGRRLLIARLLLENVTHLEIRTRLRVSPNTVWHVSRWLQEKIPEYGMTLKAIEKESQAKSSARTRKSHKDTTAPFSFADLKRRYPMHFLLFNLSEEFVDSFRNRDN